MPFSIEPCTEADFPRVFELVSLAFGPEHYPYIESVFPGHDTPKGRAAGAERLLAFDRADPNTTFLKVVEKASGTVVAVAKWNIYDGAIPPDPELQGPYWANETEREFAQVMFSGYTLPRRKAIQASGGHLVSLDILVVDPSWQRQGAGRMLVKWGTSVADRMRVETVVESTVYGLGLYKSEGFESQENYKVELPKKFEDRETQGFTWMKRPIPTS